MSNKLYTEHVDWYSLLSPVEEYEEEAVLFRAYLTENCRPVPQTILELGSGSGHNAYYLKQHFTLTLTDISSQILDLSRQLNPECAHFAGDMRTLRLNQTFDAVFIHDAIMYMTTEDDLKQALQTAYIHCRAGGNVLIIPDSIKETFQESSETAGGDGADGRSLRYLAWTHDPNPDDSTYTVDYAYLMRAADGSVSHAHDRHIEGLFSLETWVKLLKKTGFEPEVLPADIYGRINFIGRK